MCGAYARAGNADKHGILLLQQSIDMGERSRIKWLSLPPLLARYQQVEGSNPHHETGQDNAQNINGLSSGGGVLHGSSMGGVVQCMRAVVQIAFGVVVKDS